MKDKIFYYSTKFTKQDGEDDSITIEGYASTVDKDRHGDVVPSSVWQRGLNDYLKNPIILAYHDHTKPVGKMIDHRVDERGLWIKAKISDAAGDIYKLIKKGILSAFSISFMIKDAEYNAAAEVFLVKDLELHEISVVSVPANQNTLFELSKSFTTPEEYVEFKKQFAVAPGADKGLAMEQTAQVIKTKEFTMDPKDLEQLVTKAAQEASKQVLLAQETARVEADKKAKEEAELQARIKAAVAAVTPSETGADKLLAEVEKRFEREREETKNTLAGLEAALQEKAKELEAIQKSRMQFQDNKQGELSYADKEKAVLLAKMSNKTLEATKFGRELIQKYGGTQPGAHLPSAIWELEVSLAMEQEVRRRLVVAPTLRGIQMQTNVMTIPLNPEAGVATWVQNNQWGTANSAGTTATHGLKEITLNAYKVATNEYVALEEEEDALLAIMPVIRDAMVRRVARAVDRAFLRGAGAGADPVKGLATYDTASAVTLDISDNAKLTIASLRALRRDLGAWGLDPAEVVYIVNTEGYYDLLDDTTFQTMDNVGTQATLLTGQVGVVGNTPVLVSAEFADKGAGVVGAIAFAPMNFLVGNQRGLRVDTDDLVETQRRVMVASLRTGLTQVTTNNGEGVSALRYVA